MHINGGSYLTGAVGLEGHLFLRTIDYFNQYLKSREESVPRDVKKLQAASVSLLSYEEALQNLRHQLTLDAADSEHHVENTLCALCSDIHEDIKNLKLDEYLLIPGGWLVAVGTPVT